MKRNDIIEEMYTSEKIMKYAKSLSPTDWEELISSLIMELYKMKFSKLKIAKENGFIEYTCFVIMKRLKWGSNPKNTVFQKNVDNIEIELIYDIIQEEDDNEMEYDNNKRYDEYRYLISTLHWYDKTLWDMYYKEGLKLREIEELTQIKLKTVHANLTKTKTLLKQKLKK
jgi:RNA polymerase sigma factor (sigma-70 family)